MTSVRCHPELAGCGVEYCWGKLKLDFRRLNTRNNNKTHLNSSIESRIRALMPTSLPIDRCWKFERKCRDYRRLYVNLEKIIKNNQLTRENVSYKYLEKMLRHQKSHRNIIELDKEYLDNLDNNEEI